jgi:hypothetical protein
MALESQPMMMIRRKNTPTRDRGAHVEIIDLHDDNWVPVYVRRRRFKKQRSIFMMLWGATVFFVVVRSSCLNV